MAKAGKNYGNESISLLEGAERVRKRPGVIFGSDGHKHRIIFTLFSTNSMLHVDNLK